MTFSCRLSEHADGFVHGELSGDVMRSFESHLPTCSECRREVERLRQMAVLLDAAYGVELDETFNYRVINSLRHASIREEAHEMLTAFEKIGISLVSLLLIVLLSVSLFYTPHRATPVEVAGGLTSTERTSLEQSQLSRDQVVEIALRSK